MEVSIEKGKEPFDVCGTQKEGSHKGIDNSILWAQRKNLDLMSLRKLQ